MFLMQWVAMVVLGEIHACFGGRNCYEPNKYLDEKKPALIMNKICLLNYQPHPGVPK